ncbi:MAG: acetate--CoA ligase family protein [Candidatus Entotheonellia bacterium]
MTSWTPEQLHSIHRMLNPSTIAVVGATPRLQYGGRFVRAALQAGDQVRVYPVNPRYTEVMGVTCYPSLLEIPEPPDVVGIVVPYDQVMRTLEECAQKQAGSAIVISAGFAERGDAGRRDLQGQIGAFARESGVRVCGPNCLGVANLKANIWACAGSRARVGGSGPVALVSQSGASAFGPFLTRAADLKLGYSYIASTGNEADLESSDFVRYLLDDPDTRVIAGVIEGLKDGRKFMEVARIAAERGKPIVLLKVGRSAAGAKAATSHTAALTGADAVHDAVFKQSAVIRVEDYDELLETAQLLAYSPPLTREGVSIVSHSGGISSLTADKCGQMGLHLPELTEPTRQGMNEILKGFGWAANPADVTGYANSESFPQILKLMSEGPEVGILAIASSGADSQAQQVIELRDQTDTVVSFLWTGSITATDGLNKLKEGKIPVFQSPERLARGLRGQINYHHWRTRCLDEGRVQVPGMSPAQRDAIRSLASRERRVLTEYEARQFLAHWDVPGVREQRTATADEAVAAASAIGYPVVLKAESPDIPHKTEAGALRVGVRGEAELRQAYAEILQNAHRHAPHARVLGVLVQEMVAGGTEVIVGLSHDPLFGPMLLFGMGGIFVELYQDVALRACPIRESDAREMIQDVKGARLLQGYRGQPAGDLDALVQVLMRVSRLGIQCEREIQELDLNPLVVLPKGQGVKAVDALVVLVSSPAAASA